MAHQSLYRRYRSQTFAQVLGQQHVTTALRNAVREGRVGQAYLFSGPRGTGKTSTARILAKVLNCAKPDDGEPCTTCDNCLAVEQGRMVDWLHELDAASNGKVDDIRALLERVSMGTSGHRKVYILDEVHMLSAGASNALLKTLEEPPDHVVFVLATTEPHKVLPTIRSRTQHFEFKLLSAAVLADHVRHVIDDAGLDLGEDAVEHVVRAGGGSARDTLTALDQVSAAGGVLDADTSVSGVVQALGARDTAAALTAVAESLSIGREARVLGEAIVERLRTAFLASMGAPTSGLSDRQLAEAQEVADAVGPAGLTRALEAVGSALIEMRQAADPRIPLEVALVRLTRPDASTEVAALVERIERLEAALAGGAPVAAPAAPPTAESPETVVPEASPVATAPDSSTAVPASEASPASPPKGPSAHGADAARARLAQRKAPASPASVPAAEDPAPGARPTLGGVRRQRSAEPKPQVVRPPDNDTLPPPDEPAAEPPAPAASGTSGAPALGELEATWPAVLDRMSRGAQARFKIGRFVAGDGPARLALPNEPHRKNCESRKSELADALAAEFGRPVPVELVVDGDAAPVAERPAVGGAAATPATEPEDDEAVDLTDLRDAPDASTGGLAVLTDAFPGAEIEDRSGDV